MKFLGLRVGEPRAEYLDAVVALAYANRYPDIPKKYDRSIEDPQNTQKTGGILSSSDASGQTSTDELTSRIPWTIKNLRDEIEETGSGTVSGSELKFKILELAISDIGMGKYQWYLFVLCGIGWAADNLWLQGVALILPSLSTNFGVTEQFVRYATLSLNVGLSLGAAGWGIGSDIKGRKLVFNSTLIIAGVFALSLAGAKSFIAASSLLGALGVGVGGSLPVDGTMFLEFLPHNNRSYLTLLSVWWPIGQVLASLLAWLLIGASSHTNHGWRLFIYILGGITLALALVRLLFDSIESPKYLLGINKQAEAVRSVRALAHKNGTVTWLTEDILNEIGGTQEVVEEVKSGVVVKVRRAITTFGPETKKKISPLFGNPQLGLNTALLWFIWACIGMGYPLFNAFLPQYLSNGHKTGDSSNTYRDYVIISAVAVPASFFACFLVVKAGRRVPMAIATMVTGISFFLFTLRSESTFQLGFGCAASFFQNIMFGILFAYTPETFPGPSRGTGCGIGHSLNRLGGICAPLIAANIGASDPSLPVYVSAVVVRGLDSREDGTGILSGLVVPDRLNVPNRFKYQAISVIPKSNRASFLAAHCKGSKYAYKVHITIKLSLAALTFPRENSLKRPVEGDTEDLDNPHTFYTNLDFISGRVILNLTSDEAISKIVVKLEGESKTRLSKPPSVLYTQGPNPPALYTRRDRQEICEENHKVLYKVAEVFPNKAILNSYTLRAGQHEYPFRIKLPINNGCHDPASQRIGPGGGFGGLGIQGMQQMQYRHVKRTLPPSLTGFPGEAEIRYYVKVTVQRPSLFKENRRSMIGFKFLPIEAPRPPETTNEAFAKRPYKFITGGKSYVKTSLFTKKPKQSLSNEAPQGEVDARLPSPPILTCNKPLPMRILLRKTHSSPEHLFLMSLQVNLLGTTEVRASSVIRHETSTWVVMSLTGLSIPIGSPGDPIGTETVIDSKLWDAIPLPNTVAPSFLTCNLARRYELEARIGLGYGHPGNIQAQTLNIPLRFKIEIFSGIEPPAALIDAMTAQPAIPTRPPVNTAPPPFDPAYPPQVGAPGAPDLDDAPPSYEDALAEEITQANGSSRPAYSGVTNENAPGIDEKGGLSDGHQKSEASHNF
ncbi:hypothetical protein SBOR_5181 [Sclerotinia borealis F-4128]|uniref:Major facilitator superfamily (MFS) profile domain-containing protein n=1 Tax=Sclerotinia borealis (strain F-4128) TaxID=1432307 RepID=W9CEZ1_SCLBF|nr:hypothetical protein SBOR_5181 [Sclerotinia borealis F-4128]